MKLKILFRKTYEILTKYPLNFTFIALKSFYIDSIIKGIKEIKLYSRDLGEKFNRFNERR